MLRMLKTWHLCVQSNINGDEIILGSYLENVVSLQGSYIIGEKEKCSRQEQYVEKCDTEKLFLEVCKSVLSFVVVLFCFDFKIGSHNVAQAGLTILPPQP